MVTMDAAALNEFYREAGEYLARLDTAWARHLGAVGPCLHAPRPAREPYEALVRAVAYQQLHANAGDAIIARLRALFPGCEFPAPAQLASCAPEQLRGCGFSAAKTMAIRGIARGAIEGLVPTSAQAARLSDAALIDRLLPLRGVGRWTIEMFLIYTLQRMDVLPADDYGVRDGYRRLMGLERAPGAAQMRRLGQGWTPYRTVAAWYLWRVPREPRKAQVLA